MTAQEPRVNAAFSRGGEDSPAPVIPGCTRVERQVTARGASADELEEYVIARVEAVRVTAVCRGRHPHRGDAAVQQVRDAVSTEPARVSSAG